jgi:hypothetical protein
LTDETWKAHYHDVYDHGRGSVRILADAIEYCLFLKISLPAWPAWLSRAIVERLRRGAAYALADAFKECLVMALAPPAWLLPAIVETLRGEPQPVDEHDVVDYTRALEIHLARVMVGLTWEEAYDYASEMLAATPAHGAPATMKRSWDRVQANLRREPGRYDLSEESAFWRACQRLRPSWADRVRLTRGRT